MAGDEETSMVYAWYIIIRVKVDRVIEISYTSAQESKYDRKHRKERINDKVRPLIWWERFL